MRHQLLWCVAVLSLGVGSTAAAQRRFRVGPTVSSLSLEDAAGNNHGFTSFGASAALISGDEGEAGLTVARYNDLSTDSRVRRLTLFGLDSYYYPIGPRGIAPFASTMLGLARVSESQGVCVLLCQDTVATSSQLGLAFGLGVRVNAGPYAAATLEGRFLEVPNSQIQSLEARANASVALGSAYRGKFLEGTVGPVVGLWIPVSGPLRARGPLVGARFRRETKRASSVVGLEIAYAPLRVTGSCTPPGCEPNAILFAPGYEASVRPPWGRLYGEVGFLLAGFYSQGPDRGVAQGAQGGIGVDLSGGRLMWNVNSRLLWLQRNSGQSVFGVQVGVSLSPALAAH